MGERYEDIGWDWVKEPEDDKVKKWVPPGGGGDGEWVKRVITRRIDINTGTWATMHGAVGNNVINCDISTIGSNYVYSYTYDGGKFSGDKTNVVTASTDFSGIEVSTNSKNFHLANGSNLDDLYGIDVEYSDLSYTM